MMRRTHLYKYDSVTKAELLTSEYMLEQLLAICSKRIVSTLLKQRLLTAFGSFSCILTVPIMELQMIEGINDNIINAIQLIRESALWLLKEKIQDDVILSNKRELIQYCMARMRHLKVEQLHVFYLDTKNHLMSDEIISEGTISSTAIYPREIVKRALILGASAIILAHNHPSGNPTPSEADKRVTRNIIQALSSLDITVHDHIIIGATKHFSFYENGLL